LAARRQRGGAGKRGRERARWQARTAKKKTKKQDDRRKATKEEGEVTRETKT